MRIEQFHLSAPLFLFAVALLLVNDFHLKATYPGAITGKLSDIAGLFAFPFFFSLLVPRQKLPVYIITAAGFILWKLPAADAAIAAINEILPYSIGRVDDYSDYWALLVMPVAYIYKPQQVLWDNKAFQAAVASVALFAFCATAGTHGFIKSYRYDVSKYQLQLYIDSVFAYYPDLKPPQNTPALDDVSGPYFSCRVIDNHGADFFTLRYYTNKSNSNAGIAIISAGGLNNMKIENDLSSEEKERLIKKFEGSFIEKLSAYAMPSFTSEDHIYEE